MKNTYLYGVLMCFFLLMGKVEVVCGQEWYEKNIWNAQTIKEDLTIELTQNVALKGTITINAGKTLTIINKMDNDVTIKADKINITMFSVKGTFIVKGKGYDKGRVIFDGGANYNWQADDYQLDIGEGGFKIRNAISADGFVDLKYVTIQNVKGNDGAAMSIKGGANLSFCTIKLCESQRGPAMMIQGSKDVFVEDSKIIGCFSGNGSYDKTGGAIRTYGTTVASLTLVRDTLSHNYARRTLNFDNSWAKSANGGALFWNARGKNDTKCTIEECLFEYNKSDDYGGAIKSQATLEFINKPTIIRNNKAPKGAGLYIEGYEGAATVEGTRTIKYDLGENLIVENNVSPSYEYDEQENSGKGAGVHFNFRETMTLEAGSTIEVDMNGATIQDNRTEGSNGLGGGIYFENSSKTEKNYTFRILFNSGVIQRNVSKGNGGGVYIYKGNVESFDDTTDEKKLQITGNKAGVSGGGLYIKDGDLDLRSIVSITDNNATIAGGGVYIEGHVTDGKHIGNFTMANGTISDNEITNGDGGGAYINGGNFTMTNGTISNNEITNGDGGGVFIDGGSFIFTDGEITENQAGLNAEGNGGGICMLNGEVNVSDGEIKKNRCGKYGGGLYVHSEITTGQMKAFFTGGKIVENKAKYGGGVCVDGNIDLTIGAVTVDRNTAVNGGGICLLDGAEMDFGQGFIRENRATTTEIMENKTAYQKSIGEVRGIGGGVYLDTNTHLTFSTVESLGLYDNFADSGADDVFANGSGTVVSYLEEGKLFESLPVVSKMKLAEFAVAGEPYWVEDYIAGDTEYDSGTNINRGQDAVRRYRTSIQNLNEVYKVVSSEDLKNASGKYLCLAIGHDIVYVTITKKGLVEGESAIFTIELVKDGQIDTVKRTVLLTGDGGATVEKTVALATGKWKVTETSWTWAYTSNNEKSITKQIANGDSFEFVNTKKETLPLHDEAKVENSMSAGSGSE